MDPETINNQSLVPIISFQRSNDDISKENQEFVSNTGFTDKVSSSPRQRISTSEKSGEDASSIQTSTPVESVDPEKRKASGWPKGKRRRKVMKDANAPKQPLTGYMRFISVRREKLREQNPAITFAELTKILGSEWTQLPQDEKQKYLEEAERDKERYHRELTAYKKTDAYKSFQDHLEKRTKVEEAMKSAETEMEVAQGTDTLVNNALDIPIFTEEFLDHNKQRESELRQLRRQTTELEEQNAILSKHIDNMKSAIEKLEVEAVQTLNTNVALQQHLIKLRQTLVTHFSSLPGINETPTMDTIEIYMAHLHSMILDSPQDNDTLISAVRDIVARMNLDGEKS